MEHVELQDPISNEVAELFADYMDREASDRPLEYDETLHLEVTADFPFQPEQW